MTTSMLAGRWPAGLPPATQVAQQVPGATPSPVAVETVHPASTAAKVLPLAASALLWLGTLVGSLLLVLLASRHGRVPTFGARLLSVAAMAGAAPAVVLGLGRLWDHDLDIGWPLVGFLVLVAGAFAALQGGVLRLLGLRGAALLAPLYLMAPAVAAQPPELLDPTYRTFLWSWTPFRFSTETLRSLLVLDGSAPDVGIGIAVFSVMAVAGLVVLLWPARRRTVSDVGAQPVRDPAPVG